MANKISESRTNTGINGSYNAKLRMTVKNHKDTAAEVVVKYYNGYGDNLRFAWDNEEDLVKISATEYEFKKVLQPDEIWETTWEENYSR